MIGSKLFEAQRPLFGGQHVVAGISGKCLQWSEPRFLLAVCRNATYYCSAAYHSSKKTNGLATGYSIDPDYLCHTKSTNYS
jgi:hypothetical protein